MPDTTGTISSKSQCPSSLTQDGDRIPFLRRQDWSPIPCWSAMRGMAHSTLANSLLPSCRPADFYVRPPPCYLAQRQFVQGLNRDINLQNLFACFLHKQPSPRSERSPSSSTQNWRCSLGFLTRACLMHSRKHQQRSGGSGKRIRSSKVTRGYTLSQNLRGSRVKRGNTW